MGYGGLFKKVVRVVVPVVVGIATGGNPLAIAMASAATTGATGGSFKEALISGATSYVGASISAGISSSLGSGAAASNVGGAIADGTASVGTLNGVSTVFDNATGDILAQGALAESAASIAVSAGATAATAGAELINIADKASFLGGNVLDAASKANQGIENTISNFIPGANSGFGGFIEAGSETLRTPFDVFQSLADQTLPALGLDVTTQAATSGLGTAVGAYTSMTLEQALLANTPEADQALLDTGFTATQIELLKNEARNNLSQQAFERLTSETPNPFLKENQTPEELELAQQEFNKIIGAGIEKRNLDLGERVTRDQFDSVFNSPNLGQNILDDERDLRRGTFSAEVGKTFTGNAFDFSLDDDIINSILDDRQSGAANQIANFEARGNLNALGGRTAKEELARQREQANTRLQGLGEGILSGYQRELDTGLRNEALQTAQSFNLGDELFDISPYAEQRQSFIDERIQNLPQSFRDTIGAEQLFNSNNAIKTAGATQGLVSGAPTNSALLDTLAARASESRKRDRTLGSQGSGAF